MPLCPGLRGWTGTRKVKPILILLKQETVSSSGISWAVCKSAPRSRQKTTPAIHRSVFYRPDALPATQPTASKHWRHWQHKINTKKTRADLSSVLVHKVDNEGGEVQRDRHGLPVWHSVEYFLFHWRLSHGHCQPRCRSDGLQQWAPVQWQATHKHFSNNHVIFNNNNNNTATVLRPLYRSPALASTLQLTRRFCWCKVLLPEYPCWRQPVHSN